MPGSDGVPWIGRLRAQFPTLPIIVVSAEESCALVRELIDCGVAGFIPKSDSAAGGVAGGASGALGRNLRTVEVPDRHDAGREPGNGASATPTARVRL